MSLLNVEPSDETPSERLTRLIKEISNDPTTKIAKVKATARRKSLTADVSSTLDPALVLKRSKSAAKTRKPRKETPLSRFRTQTLKKKADLKKAEKDIHRELKAIEKDLGVLKRKAK